MTESPSDREGIPHVQEPFPIYLVAGRYMLYDVNVVSYIRRAYRMCGCLIGTLPQVPQQNVFLGLPLELMREEAALLLEKGAGYIVDDAMAHESGLKAMLETDKQKYLKQREDTMQSYAEGHARAAQERKAKFLENKKSKLVSTETTRAGTPTHEALKFDGAVGEGAIMEEEGDDKQGDHTGESAEGPSVEETSVLEDISKPQQKDSDKEILGFHVIPATSSSTFHSLPSPPITPPDLIPAPPPNSYPIYRYLNQKGYFLSPALRFGAQYLAYPGDPLRFHSHFVVNGLDWDEEIAVMDIVGGGRLGTGVKKGWMVGGTDPGASGGDGSDVRVFSVEWGGF